MGNQRNQSILLAVCQLAEALQQLTLMERQFRTVQAQARFVTQGAFLDQALLETRNDLGIHTAVMEFGDFRDALAHAFRETDNELVSCAT